MSLTDRYAIAGKIMELKKSLGVSNKDWDNAIALISLEIDDRRSRFAPASKQVNEGPSPSKSKPAIADKPKKEKTGPPAPNSAKQSKAYKDLEAYRLGIVNDIKGGDLEPHEHDSALAKIKVAETQMKILRGSPNASAAGGSSSSYAAALKVDGQSKRLPDVGDAGTTTSNEERLQKRIMKMIFETGSDRVDGEAYSIAAYSTVGTIKALIKTDAALGCITAADRKAITNAIANGNLHTDDALKSAWRDAVQDFHSSALARVENGGRYFL